MWISIRRRRREETRTAGIQPYGRLAEGRLYIIEHSLVAILQSFAIEKDAARF
jgi:hypothetical protein